MGGGASTAVTHIEIKVKCFGPLRLLPPQLMRAVLMAKNISPITDGAHFEHAGVGIWAISIDSWNSFRA